MGTILCDITLPLLNEGLCKRPQKQGLQGSPSCGNDLGGDAARKVGEIQNQTVFGNRYRKGTVSETAQCLARFLPDDNPVC